MKLTGLVDHWPALKLWTPDYLEQKVGDALVELQGHRGSSADYELFKERHQRRVPMREVVAAIRKLDSSNDFYVTAYNDTTNKQTLAPLWDDLAPVSILKPTGGRDGFFWFGPKGTLTPLHHDLTNNLLVQVLGRKRVLMVPPWELERVRNHLHCFSSVTLAELQEGGEGVPDVVECLVGPGEAVFLPVGWWHHVEALDVSISMSFTNFPYENEDISRSAARRSARLCGDCPTRPSGAASRRSPSARRSSARGRPPVGTAARPLPSRHVQLERLARNRSACRLVHTSSRGSVTSTDARASSCFWPPESRWAGWSRWSPSPKEASAPRTFARCCSSG